MGQLQAIVNIWLQSESETVSKETSISDSKIQGADYHCSVSTGPTLNSGKQKAVWTGGRSDRDHAIANHVYDDAPCESSGVASANQRSAENRCIFTKRHNKVVLIVSGTICSNEWCWGHWSGYSPTRTPWVSSEHCQSQSSHTGTPQTL